MQVNVTQARKQWSRLIKSVQAGEDIVITVRGEPVVRLVPIAAGKRKQGKGKGDTFAMPK